MTQTPLFFTAAVEDWNEDHLLTAERGGGTFPKLTVDRDTNADRFLIVNLEAAFIRGRTFKRSPTAGL